MGGFLLGRVLLFLIVVSLVEGFQYGKVRMGHSSSSCFKCKQVTYQNAFAGSGPIRVLVSVNHGAQSSRVHESTFPWVESVTSTHFNACLVEGGIGGEGNATIDWVAFQGNLAGVAQGRSTFSLWTAGTKCNRVALRQVSYSRLPAVFVTTLHGTTGRKQDAMNMWVEDIASDHFVICLRESRTFDGPHDSIDVDWAVVNMDGATSWLEEEMGKITFDNSILPDHSTNYAFCKDLNFTNPFFAPPSIITTPNHHYDSSNSNSIPPENNAINAWIEEVTETTFKVCIRDLQGMNSVHDPVTVDYAVFGDISPCVNRSCDYFALCKAFSPTDARCVCEESCPNYEELVCASNGRTFDNLCLLKREICRTSGNYTYYHPGSCHDFPLERGRKTIHQTQVWAQDRCEVVHFKPHSFYPHKNVQVQLTVNYYNSSQSPRVHEATVLWAESVSHENFTVCVTRAGRNDKPSNDFATVDWVAYQGAPNGSVAGETKFVKWWTGTTCNTVNLPSGKFQNVPTVLITPQHFRKGLKHDAASAWIEDSGLQSFKICLRELQSFDGEHDEISVNWLAFESIHRPIFSEHGYVDFPNDQHPLKADNFAFCKNVRFQSFRGNISPPTVILSAKHTSGSGRIRPECNGISAWIENINVTDFRICVKELYVQQYDPITVSYAVLSDICMKEWTYFRGACYRASTSCANWNNAQAACSTSGSNLSSIRDQLENVFIQKQHGAEHTWIGLNDINTEGVFIWNDGAANNFTFWAKNQPNDFRGEDCVHTLGQRNGYRWNDVSCSLCHNYTCKKYIDMCRESLVRCPRGTRCISKAAEAGFYVCQCPTGHVLSGYSCEDVNECTRSPGCHSDARCVNTIGSYRCICNEGYFGNGRSCNAITMSSGGSCGTLHASTVPNGGEMMAPGYPGVYGNGENCYWELRSNTNIGLFFKTFFFEPCCDFVTVYDGSSSSAAQIGRYTGTTLPPFLTSSSTNLYITFTSDGSVTYTGFAAKYEAIVQGSLRLVGGSSKTGRVEVFYSNQWGTICDNDWDINDARAACEQLGFPGATAAPKSARYGQGTGRIWFDNMECTGSESNIQECSHRGWGIHSCDHSQDASVECERRVRLVNGGASYGRVEVYHQGVWGTVCDDYWDITDANVVCRELGYSSASSAHQRAYYGQGSGPIWISALSCLGSETSLLSCGYRGWISGNSGCSHSEDAGVNCN